MGDLIGVGSLVDQVAVVNLLARLALDLVFASVVVQCVYFRLYKRRDHVFTCYLFNVVTLCLCLLLRKGPTELGLALTLFGVFGILRYRTEQIRSRDLTYLFILIGIGIINGVADKTVSVTELLVINGVIAGMTVVIEGALKRHAEEARPMLYDRLDLLQPGQEAALLADVVARTGLAVSRLDIERVDLLRDAAELIIYFRRAPASRKG